MRLKDKALRSIGYDPMSRKYFIDRRIRGIRFTAKSYYRENVERYISNRIKNSLDKRNLLYKKKNSNRRRDY